MLHLHVSLAVALAACSSLACSDDASHGTNPTDDDPAIGGVNVCHATVSGTPSGVDETFEMHEVDTTRAPVTTEEKAARLATTVTTWRDTGGGFSCLFSDPIGDKGNFRNRLGVFGHMVEGKPPLELDESGDGYTNINIRYLGAEPGDPEWICEGSKDAPVGRFSVKLDSVAVTGRTDNGLYGRALLEGSFEAVCPLDDDEDVALDAVTIKGSWTIVPGNL